MLFNSYQFWLFLAVVILLYRSLPHRGQNRMLLIASYVFYAAWDWRFLSLILISTAVDYWVALGLGSHAVGPGRRRLLLVSLVTNLGLLGVFKYYGFFSRELAAFLEALGLSASIPTLDLVLPVGISFYTFQTLSYTIDVYRGRTRPCRSFLDFALYVAFFPQLVAGPIERPQRLLPQMLARRTVTSNDFREGLHHVMLGLFKKVVIADNMAPIVDTVFSKDLSSLSGGECLVGLYAFAFQIYGDFSGYSSIAKGIARWMGFDIMTNFAAPYFARSPREFWRRWHISLSTWLRDYLYIPLGGNRGTRLFTYRNLLLTMLIGGLWHGAAWTFLAWGLYHGILLAITRLWEHSGPQRSAAPRSRLVAFASIIGTFHLVCLGWLFFRAASMTQAWHMLGAIATDLSAGPFVVAALSMIIFFTVPLLLYEFVVDRGPEAEIAIPEKWQVRAAVYAYCSGMLLFFPPPTSHEFIYFQF